MIKTTNDSNKKKILNFAKQKKFIKPGDLSEIIGIGAYISRLVEKGELVKIGRGLYSLPENEISEWETYLETARIVPNGVFCLLSALLFHDLTTQNPFQIWIALEGTAREPKVETINLNMSRFSGKAFSEGVEVHNIDGINLKVYNPAKTVADCFKFRNKIGLDVAIEALRDTWRQKKATMDELWYFAKVCRMSNVMRPYLESLV